MMKFLVVDDVAIMRFVLVETLVRSCKASRDQIYEAEDGTKAIEQYKEVKPDIVFLDITMHDLDGLDVVKEIISINPLANIVMYTASTDEADVAVCIQAGAKDCILKPANPERVIEIVKNLMKSEN